MEKLKNTPTLRFPEFKEEWELKKLGKIAKVSSGGTPSRAKPSYWDGDIPWVSTTLIDFNTILESNELITNDGLANSSAKLFPKGTLLMAMYGQGKTRGKVAILGIEATTNQACGAITPNNDKLNELFLFQNLAGRYDEIRDLSNQGGQENLSGEIIKNILITLPTLPEQQKIATFLKAVDEKLQALKQKKSFLEQYKKGVMQQIFSQELRFKDDNGNAFAEWEEKKVKDIFVVTRGNVLSMTLVSENQDNNNFYPVYSSQTKKNGLSGYYNTFLFEDCITWTTDGAGAGDVNFRKGKFYCTNVCGVLKSDKGYANVFVAEILNSISRKYVSYVGNPKLMNNVMAEISISIPTSIEEQTKIANFLSTIDEKINHCQAQITSTEVWKKGLLQGMFV
ncbi:restriction endonuclease subunit S [Flavobacterium caseinilyticum]|uniref:Restriction endonuclease subunit S n=1 Tax=Flavobacterium caseinilyticum TaxID=2541732 RepID=A0A4V6PER4_9FLAO|nr:restriction endonuclease subunit S [Flavobacterium caseinilyticum]TDD78407.1 restriction endonuclease subunit S [Flavobacterium caseinilyticum]